MLSFNIADLFEVTAATTPERVALIAGSQRLTYAQLLDRAQRVGRYLVEQGLRPGEHIAVLSWNRAEWLEAMLGAFMARVVPINVNYRYTADELDHILRDSEAVAVLAERSFMPLIEQVVPTIPAITQLILLDAATDEGSASSTNTPMAEHGASTENTGSTEGAGNAPVSDALAQQCQVVSYEAALASISPDTPLGPRSGDDHYILYTGGTTGAPKGVVWRNEDIFFAALGGGRPGGTPISRPEELADALVDRQPWLVTSPLMHGNGQWNSLVPLLTGQGVIMWTEHRFDAASVARLAVEERAHLLVLIGDGMALPFADVCDAWPGTNTPAEDLAHLRVIISGGAILSPTLKARLAEHLPHVTVIDGFGASETGSNGRLLGSDHVDGPPRFSMNPDTMVLNEQLRPVAAGEIGRLARRGHVPLRYWNDPDKSAETFPTDADGTRWAVPGDYARLEDDGTITLLGRGSASINTGGEKVHPEEVSLALKAHPDITDCIVVGGPHPRFGQQVVAIVQPAPGASVTVESIREFLRPQLAGYKAPRHLILSTPLVYTAQGKPDVRWATELAASDLERVQHENES